MYRKITTDFWNDAKVEKLSSTARFVLLYLLTSPRTNLVGCYEVTCTAVQRDTDLRAAQVEKAIAELHDAHVISYCKPTSEVLIRNWSRHNWTRSPKVQRSLEKAIGKVKCAEFRQFLIEAFEGMFDTAYNGELREDTVSIQYQESENPSSDTVCIQYPYCSVPVNNITSEEILLEESTSNTSQVGTGSQVEEIVGYLNAKTGSSFRATTKETADKVRGRLGDGYTVDDFKAVIDCKAEEWSGDPKMSRYLQPSTLFRPTNFENYLNQARRGKAVSGKYAKYR